MAPLAWNHHRIKTQQTNHQTGGTCYTVAILDVANTLYRWFPVIEVHIPHREGRHSQYPQAQREHLDSIHRAPHGSPGKLKMKRLVQVPFLRGVLFSPSAYNEVITVGVISSSNSKWVRTNDWAAIPGSNQHLNTRYSRAKPISSSSQRSRLPSM